MDEPPRFGAEGSGEALYATTERVRFEDVIPNFVSQHVRKKLDKYSAEGHSDMKSFKSSAESAFAAVVMADVSGYSALTANLAERGPVGAEILAKTMKGLLDKVIQIIIFYGGDIVKFIGDAIMFYWKLDGPLEDIDPTLGEDLEPADLARRAELVVQAAICCSEILKQYGTYPINIPDCTTTELKIHLGIGAGRIFDVHVGGDPGRWEHLIGGDAVSQLANVLDQAPPGRLALSHTALKHMKGSINMSALEIVDYNKKAAVILHFDKDRIRRNTTARPTLADDLALWDIASPTQNIELYRQFINHSALFKLQSDINQSKVFSSEFPGLSELMSLFELRQATTLFVRIGGYAQDGFRWFETKDDLEDMQTAMEIVQKALFRFQGSLRQFHVDDKGAILLSFFGLPPHAHENDAQYGVKAALEIAEEFGRFFEHFNIGITTGVIAIGGVGNSVRTEYALMGDSINMAARIMCLEAAQNAVACDERTYNLCSKDFTFEDMGQHKVKGKKNPVKVFRPKCAVADTRVQKTNDPEGMGLVVGRGKEKAMLSESVRTHINEGGGGLLVFEGDGGMGLTTLMKYAKLQAVNAGCPITSGCGSEMEKTTPYFAFRDIIGDILTMVDEALVDEAGILIPTNNTVSKAVVIETMLHPGSVALQGPNGSGDSIISTSRERSLSLAVPDTGGDVGGMDILLPLSQTRSARSNSVTRRLDTALLTTGEQLGVDGAFPRPMRSNSVSHRPEHLADSDSGNGGGGADRPSPGLLTVSTGGQAHAKARGHRASLMGSIDALTNNRAKRRLSIMATNIQLENQAAQKRQETEDRVKSSLVKLGENPALAQLMSFVTLFDLSVDTSRQHKGRGRQKEFQELVKRIISTLSTNNPLTLIFHEAQWMDISSWELLLEIINGCPDVLVMIFSRPERSFDDRECSNWYSQLKKMSKAKTRIVEGLSESEIAEMIRYYWNKDGRHEVKRVGTAILSNVHRRTNGNPLYARSLVIALKESGQTHVEENGELQLDNDTAFDFEHFSVDDDLQSIVVAQFDRLDRNFQLLLKVGSAFGHRFALEDVLIFLPDTKALIRDTNGMLSSSFGGSKHVAESLVDKKMNAGEISRSLGRFDKYGFLQKFEGEHGQTTTFNFEYKSALIRRCVYNIMTVTQRQQLHLKIATYYETQKLYQQAEKEEDGKIKTFLKLRPDGLRYLIPVYEHYSETSDDYRNKKIFYLEKVSHFYYQKHLMGEAVKYYKKLFQSVAEYQMDTSSSTNKDGSSNASKYTSLDFASWNQELGEAYLYRGEFESAERHLLNSLRLCEVRFPKGDIALSWAVRKERSVLSRLKPDPNEEKEEKRLLQEKSANALGRRESKSPLASISRTDSQTTSRERSALQDMVEKNYALACMHVSRLSLLALTDLYLAKEQQNHFQFCALSGLNISEKFPKETLYARFRAAAALAVWLSHKDEALAVRYLVSAEAWDTNNDANATASIASLSANIYFMMGQWTFAIEKYEILNQIGVAISDQARREESLRMRSIIHLFQGSTTTAQRFAMDLLRMAEREHFWPARYWGTTLMFIAELNSLSPNVETLKILVPTLDLIKEQKEQHGTGTVKTPFNSGLFAEILATAGRLRIAASVSEEIPLELATDVCTRTSATLSQMKQESSLSNPQVLSLLYLALVNLILEVYGLYRSTVNHSLSTEVQTLCQAAVGLLKSDMKTVRLHHALLSIFRGLLHVAQTASSKRSTADWEEGHRKATKHQRPWLHLVHILCRLIISCGGSPSTTAKFENEKSRLQDAMASAMNADENIQGSSIKNSSDPLVSTEDLRRLVGVSLNAIAGPGLRASGMYGIQSSQFGTGTIMRAAHSRALRSNALAGDPPPSLLSSPASGNQNAFDRPTVDVPNLSNIPPSPVSPSILDPPNDSPSFPRPGLTHSTPLLSGRVSPFQSSRSNLPPPEEISEELEAETTGNPQHGINNTQPVPGRLQLEKQGSGVTEPPEIHSVREERGKGSPLESLIRSSSNDVKSGTGTPVAGIMVERSVFVENTS